MKKIFLILIICTALVGCGVRSTDLEALRLKGEVKEIEQRLELEVDDFYKTIYFGGTTLINDIDVEFDERGFVTGHVHYYNEMPHGTVEREIDKKGYVLESRYESESGDYKIKVSFDSEDDLAIIDDHEQVGDGETEYLNEYDSKEDMEVTITYDEEGRLIEEETDYKDYGKYKIEYKYKDDVLVEIEEGNDESQLEIELEYEDGLISAYEYEKDDKTLEFEFEYEAFDEVGNWTEMKVFVDDEFIGTVLRDIDYY